jgi:hypothetical protein
MRLGGSAGARGALSRWIDANVLELGRELRLSFLPPLMVYFAAGVSGLTAIVGTFFVKEYLGLSAEFLAGLAFWAGIPWALKMPLGHLVDLIWRHKAALVYIGAALIATSLLIMLGLLRDPDAMRALLPAEAWYVIAALLSPVGYVVQDVVADAMTVEAVPRHDAQGHAIDAAQRRRMNTAVQTLGRVAIIGGGLLVALVNVVMFQGTESLPQADKAAIYAQVYAMALVIPAVSVLGVALARLLRSREARRLRAKRRNRGCALHRTGGHHARVASRADRDGSDAGMDRELGTGEAQGHLFRGDGVLHEPGTLRLPARDALPEPALRGDPAGDGPGDGCGGGSGVLRRARSAAAQRKRALPRPPLRRDRPREAPRPAQRLMLGRDPRSGAKRRTHPPIRFDRRGRSFNASLCFYEDFCPSPGRSAVGAVLAKPPTARL